MAIEKIDRILTFLGSIKDVIDMLGKAGDSIPEPLKQRMPKLFGLTLDDECIFNSVVAQLKKKEQIIVHKFLFEKCKDYERNRFINIVAGMEVIPGKPSEVKIEIDKKSSKEVRTEKPGAAPVDNRKNFLESFAKIISDPVPRGFGGDLDKAYEFCVGGRMIIADPLHQKALRAFSESVSWLKNKVLTPFGVDSLRGLSEKVAQNGAIGMDNLNANMETLMDRARRWRDRA